jgi:chemotaxis protein CheX
MAAVLDGALVSIPMFKVTDAAFLDQAVDEVFALMLGIPVQLIEEKIVFDSEAEVLTAMIGLAGAISGTCAVLANAEGAIHMANCMAETELNSVDETIMDGLGEISNMLAGAWKAKIPELDAACMLSVPTVVSGSHYIVHRKEPAFLVERNYRLDQHRFTVKIYGVID